ncbi:hypothetical protein HID58_022495, partial [Brassica napus]
MAARSDEQMSFLFSTIDQIDELEHRTNCHVKRSIFADCHLMRLKILYVASVPTFSLAEMKLRM